MTDRTGAFGRRGRGMVPLLAALLLVAFSASAFAQVSGLRLKGDGTRVRLELDTAARADFRIFALTDPWRIVADFPGISFDTAPLGEDDLPVNVAGFRFGLFQPGMSRIVMELDGPMRVARAVASENRFVLELAPASEAEFAASAGWPEDARWVPGEDIVPEVAGEGGIVIALDPGHGGVDPGAVVEGAVEKRLVLDFARALQERLVATGRFRVFLTRDRDIFVPLAERVRRARAAGANVILSLHADVVTAGIAEGSSVYTLPDRAAGDTADELALEQNRVDVLVGADLAGESDVLTHVLIELAQRGTQIESLRLAEALVAALSERVGVIHSRPHRAVAFRVLKAPDTPSVLIELGYLSSAADRAKLADPDWHARASEAIVVALEAWAAGARPDFVRPREVR